MSKLKFAVRAPTAEDTALIFSTWLKSCAESPQYRHIGRDLYFAVQHGIIESYIADAACAWLIAHDPENPRFVYGYLCGQVLTRASESVSPTIHFVYVKKTFRRLGVASELVTLMGATKHAAPITTTWTPRGEQLLSAMEIKANYNPWLQWGRAAELK
jgi:GNAT superfamily N-acetyltransferase